MSNLITIDDLRGSLMKGRDQIAMALPRHLTPERMIRLALTTFSREPGLAECDLKSILGAIVQASQLGLEIDGVLGHAYLVPFYNSRAKRKECQLIVGYKGYLSLARRSGEVSAFFAHVVHERDEFAYQYGTRADLVHVPCMQGERGQQTAVYAVIRLRDGSSDFEVLPWADVLACQQQYAKRTKDGKVYGPWVDHLDEMAKKTAIRRLAKRCPVSVEIQRAATLDEYHDTGTEQHLGDLSPLTRTEQIAGRLASRAGVPQLATPGQLDRIEAMTKALGVSEAVWQERCAAVGAATGQFTAAQAADLLEWLEDLAACAEREAAETQEA